MFVGPSQMEEREKALLVAHRDFIVLEPFVFKKYWLILAALCPHNFMLGRLIDSCANDVCIQYVAIQTGQVIEKTVSLTYTFFNQQLEDLLLFTFSSKEMHSFKMIQTFSCSRELRLLFDCICPLRLQRCIEIEGLLVSLLVSNGRFFYLQIYSNGKLCRFEIDQQLLSSLNLSFNCFIRSKWLLAPSGILKVCVCMEVFQRLRRSIPHLYERQPVSGQYIIVGFKCATSIPTDCISDLVWCLEEIKVSTCVNSRATNLITNIRSIATSFCQNEPLNFLIKYKSRTSFEPPPG